MKPNVSLAIELGFNILIIVGFLAFYRMDSFLRSFLLIRIAKISIFFFK